MIISLWGMNLQCWSRLRSDRLGLERLWSESCDTTSSEECRASPFIIHKLINISHVCNLSNPVLWLKIVEEVLLLLIVPLKSLWVPYAPNSCNANYDMSIQCPVLLRSGISTNWNIDCDSDRHILLQSLAAYNACCFIKNHTSGLEFFIVVKVSVKFCSLPDQEKF